MYAGNISGLVIWWLREMPRIRLLKMSIVWMSILPIMLVKQKKLIFYRICVLSKKIKNKESLKLSPQNSNSSLSIMEKNPIYNTSHKFHALFELRSTQNNKY